MRLEDETLWNEAVLGPKSFTTLASKKNVISNTKDKGGKTIIRKGEEAFGHVSEHDVQMSEVKEECTSDHSSKCNEGISSVQTRKF